MFYLSLKTKHDATVTLGWQDSSCFEVLVVFHYQQIQIALSGLLYQYQKDITYRGPRTNYNNISREKLRGCYLAMDVSDWMILLKQRKMSL